MDEALQISTTRAMFVTSWDHEKPGIPVSLEAMLEANGDDPALCRWLEAADKVGLEYRVGGGAAPLCVIRRIA